MAGKVPTSTSTASATGFSLGLRFTEEPAATSLRPPSTPPTPRRQTLRPPGMIGADLESLEKVPCETRTFILCVNKGTGEVLSYDEVARKDEHLFDKVQVKADVPIELAKKGPDAVKEFWKLVGQQLQDKVGLPRAGETATATVHDQSIEYAKDNTKIVCANAALSAACTGYSAAQLDTLRQALEPLRSSLQLGPPLYNSAPPPLLTYDQNNCFVQANIQRLLANPLLLEQLPNAIAREKNKPKEKKALGEIQRILHYCVNKPGKPVPKEEVEAFRTALLDIAPQDCSDQKKLIREMQEMKPEDTEMTFSWIKDLILRDLPAAAGLETKAITERTLQGESQPHRQEQAHDGGIYVTPPGENQELHLADYLNTGRVLQNPMDSQGQAIKIGNKQVTEEKRLYQAPTKHLHGIIGRTTPGSTGKVILPCTLERQAEDYVDSTTPEQRRYELAFVTFHNSSHFTTLTRKRNSDGTFTSYYRNGTREPQTFTDAQCAAFLKEHADKITSFDYLQPDVLKAAIEHPRTRAKKYVEPSPPKPTPTAGETPSAEAAEIEEIPILHKEVELGDGKRATPLRVIQGDINAQVGKVVNFTEKLDEKVRSAAKTALQALPPPPRWFGDVTMIPTKDGDTRQIIHTNPGSTENELKAAVAGVLHQYADQKIAFPLPENRELGLANTFRTIFAAADAFTKKNPKTEVTIILTPEQRAQLDQANELPKPKQPAPPPPPPESLLTIVKPTPVKPQGSVYGSHPPVNISVEVYEKKPPLKAGYAAIEEQDSKPLPKMIMYQDESTPPGNTVGETNFSEILEKHSKLGHKKITLYIPLEEGKRAENINRETTEQRLRSLVEKLSGFKGAGFTDVEIIVLLPEAPTATPTTN